MGFDGNHEKWIFSKIRKKVIPVLKYVEHKVILQYSPKDYGRELMGKIVMAHGVKAPKMTFLPILGVKNSENQNFFFLQISIFLGPIDGINDIFWSGLPFWLYSES